MKRDIFLRYKYDNLIYVYMLIRYCMYNILTKEKKIGMLQFWYQSCSNLRRPKGYGLVYVWFIWFVSKTK